MDNVKRDEKGRVLPGSRLAAGRPKTSAITAFRDYLAPHWQAIQDKLIEKAKQGDLDAIEVVVSRMTPPARPEAERVSIPGLREATTLQAKADLVVEAMARGDITVEASRQALAVHVRSSAQCSTRWTFPCWIQASRRPRRVLQASQMELRLRKAREVPPRRRSRTSMHAWDRS